ncbi:hypothetical protein SRB17_86420 [Streptomyces sp. RB17]|nr:hypothetical protein [Streptomyces sp. RB17]
MVGEWYIERISPPAASAESGLIMCLPSHTIVDLLPCVSTGIVTGSMYDKIRYERGAIQQRITELTAARDKLDSVIEHVLRVGIYEEPTPQAAG